jgi:hypothetical protein
MKGTEATGGTFSAWAFVSLSPYRRHLCPYSCTNLAALQLLVTQSLGDVA